VIDMTVADVLRAAADRVQIGGLHKGDFGDYGGYGPVCIVGSIYAVRYVCGATDPLPPPFGDAIDTVGVLIGCDAGAWNDLPRRTSDDVIAALLSAAAEWEAGDP
jgi:hypothetical protein